MRKLLLIIALMFGVAMGEQSFAGSHGFGGPRGGRFIGQGKFKQKIKVKGRKFKSKTKIKRGGRKFKKKVKIKRNGKVKIKIKSK